MITWRAEFDPFVLRIHAEPADGADAGFDFTQLAEFSTVVVQPDGQQRIVVTDGFNHIRIDVESGSLIDGPVRICMVCTDHRHMKCSAVTMQRLTSVWQHGRFIRKPSLRADVFRFVWLLRFADGTGFWI